MFTMALEETTFEAKDRQQREDRQLYDDAFALIYRRSRAMFNVQSTRLWRGIDRGKTVYIAVLVVDPIKPVPGGVSGLAYQMCLGYDGEVRERDGWTEIRLKLYPDDIIQACLEEDARA